MIPEWLLKAGYVDVNGLLRNRISKISIRTTVHRVSIAVCSKATIQPQNASVTRKHAGAAANQFAENTASLCVRSVTLVSGKTRKSRMDVYVGTQSKQVPF